MPENKKTDNNIDDILLRLINKHNEEIQLDVEEFFDLLEHSLSLDLLEKKKVIDKVPELSQFQFDELIKVFKEEREKFRELAWKHPEDIKKLLAKQQAEWIELKQVYEMEEKEKTQVSEDEQKIDDIKKNLGL